MNQFVIWNDLNLFHGSSPQALSKHSHPVIQLVLATQNHFLSKDSTGEWFETTGLLIAPNQFHECDARDVPIVSLEIDPLSSLGEWILTHQLKENNIVEYTTREQEIPDIENIVNELINQNWKAVRNLLEEFFLFLPSYKPTQSDERIDRVLHYISDHIHLNITTKKLTEVAFLSESRLLHLFKDKMGLPIRNYILWYRIKIAITHILAGHSLITASYKAGFSDQAHLTRTFVKMLGIPPSIISKNSKFIQVIFPE